MQPLLNLLADEVAWIDSTAVRQPWLPHRPLDPHPPACVSLTGSSLLAKHTDCAAPTYGPKLSIRS